MQTDKTVLVVDDDDAIRALISTILRRRGFRVDAARNGNDALEKMSERCYSLIILDLMMPQMNGYEVLAQLAGWAASARPVVLVLTAGAEPRPFDTTFVIGTIHKPFDIELLLDTVTACIGSARESRDRFPTPSPSVSNAPDEAN